MLDVVCCILGLIYVVLLYDCMCMFGCIYAVVPGCVLPYLAVAFGDFLCYFSRYVV